MGIIIQLPFYAWDVIETVANRLCFSHAISGRHCDS